MLLAVSVLLVLVTSFFCSLSEASLLSVSPLRLHTLAAKSPAAAVVLRMKETMNRPLAAILILNTIANTAGAAVAGREYAQQFGNASMALFTATFTLAVLILAEIVPKTLGVTYGEQAVLLVGRPLSSLVWVLQPLTALVEKLTRVLGSGQRRSSQAASLEDLRAMARLAVSTKALGREEQMIIDAASRLPRVAVRNIMIHREDIVFLSLNQSEQENLVRAQRTMHSRLPLCHKDLDDLLGIVNLKEVLWRLVQDPEDREEEGFNRILGEALREPLFVDADMDVSGLLQAFSKAHEHMAVVKSKDGRVVGIVTLEDIIEELVGEIDDEFDRSPTQQEVLSDSSWRFGGGRLWSDVARTLALPDDEHVDEDLDLDLDGRLDLNDLAAASTPRPAPNRRHFYGRPMAVQGGAHAARKSSVRRRRSFRYRCHGDAVRRAIGPQARLMARPAFGRRLMRPSILKKPPRQWSPAAFINHPATDVVVMLLIAASVVLLFMEEMFELPDDSWVPIASDAITYVFAVELALRYFVAKKKGRFFRRYWPDLLAVLPLLRPLRIFRLFRLFRLLRLFQLGLLLDRRVSVLSGLLRMNFYFLWVFVLVTALLIFGSAAIVHSLEQSIDGTSFSSWPNTLWWAAYSIIAGEPVGDGMPQTSGGRVLMVLMMLSGMTLFAVFTGVVSATMITRLEGGAPLAELDIEELEGHVLICGWNTGTLPLLSEMAVDKELRGLPLVLVNELEALPDLSRTKVRTDIVYHVPRRLHAARGPTAGGRRAGGAGGGDVRPYSPARDRRPRCAFGARGADHRAAQPRHLLRRRADGREQQSALGGRRRGSGDHALRAVGARAGRGVPSSPADGDHDGPPHAPARGDDPSSAGAESPDAIR